MVARTAAVGSSSSQPWRSRVVLIWLAVSLGGALTDPALGSSVGPRFAEWAREHGGGGLVNWVENEWYSHHPPKVGRQPPTWCDPDAGGDAPDRRGRRRAGPAHLPAPAPIVPFASPAIPGEGEWSPVGRPVDGLPAVYETTLRPDAVHTSYVVGVAWMDTDLLKATLYSGSQIPGGGPFTHTAPIAPHRGHQPGRRLQRRVPHVQRKRRLLHRRPVRHPAAHRRRPRSWSMPTAPLRWASGVGTSP